MMLQAGLRASWIFLLFGIGTCLPVRKGVILPKPGYTSGGMGTGSSDSGFGSGYYTSSDSFSGFGSGPSGSSVDAGIAQMIAELMSMGPNRPAVQSHWNADYVPLGMIQNPPVYPSSHIIYTGSGYQRAQDSRTDSKYTTDTFNNIPAPGVPQDQQGTKS